jgi:hypothetical protein
VTAYRDADEALRVQLRALRDACDERVQRATAHFWRTLPRDMADEYAALRARSVPPSDDRDALGQARDAAAACVALLDRALATLPEVERAWATMPPEAPLITPTHDVHAISPLHDPVRCASHAQDLLGALMRHDRGATLRGHSMIAYEVSARVGGVPLRFLVEVPLYALFRSSGAPDVVVQASTALCHAVEPFRLRSEGWLDGMLKRTGIRREVTFDDAAFDATFFVEGDAAAIRATLTPPVRASLMVLARFDVPVLSVAPGEALLRWNYEPRPDMIDAAVTLLSELRSTPPTLKLRTG